MTRDDTTDYAPKRAAMVVDLLGREITSGALAPGSTMRLDDVESRFGVSRTLARDAVKELEGLGLIVSRRRVGLQIQEPAQWRVYDPKVIAWRVASDRREAQLTSLTELRVGIEPAAATLAATRRTGEQADRLLDLAAELDTAGRAHDDDAYLRADVAFHGLILEATRNEFFVALVPSVHAALTSRTREGLMPPSAVVESFELHRAVAEAIERRDPAAAGAAMRRILIDVIDEVRSR